MDRIFTRIGASDNLARGRSTFMVEMTETAVILNTATPRSLVVLDEIGRGTATYDGLALAWAVVEYLHARTRARTLFATHYHELTELADQLEGVRNLRVSVKEAGGRIIFLRKVEPGRADRSYGIEVARLAGLPLTVDGARAGGPEAARAHRARRHRRTYSAAGRTGTDPAVRTRRPRHRRTHPRAQHRRTAPGGGAAPAQRIAGGVEELMRVAGIMSGTSLDGIDVAIVDLRGAHISTVAARSFPFPEKVRAAILAVSNTTTNTAAIARLNFQLGEVYARAVKNACRAARVDLKSVELIGCHGQTIYHEGGGVATMQIGEAAVIAERTGIAVVSDFRPRDIAAGGQGAPLVPFVDYLLYRHPRRGRIALNIGGIANITAIPPGAAPGDVVAFDTGPGNMVIDALAAVRSRRSAGARWEGESTPS